MLGTRVADRSFPSQTRIDDDTHPTIGDFDMLSFSRAAFLTGTICATLLAVGATTRFVLPEARGAEPPQEEKLAHPKYLGTKGCKLCHIAPSTGNQMKVWSGGPHAKAYKSLASEEAKKLGAAKGIADPQKAPECLKCHVTGYGEPADHFSDKFSMEEGVSCESCHGPGEHYAKKEVFEKGKDEAVRLGLIEPTEAVCKKCHNEESPSYKPFNFEEFSKKIAHPKPKAEGK